MDAPSIEEVRARSALLTEKYPPGEGDVGLSMLLLAVAPLVGSLTGRKIGSYAGDANMTVEDVPEGMVELAVAAIALKGEQLTQSIGTADEREDSVATATLRSISAGSWSEAYTSPNELIAGKVIEADPILNAMLWALCTADRRAEWLFLWDPAHAPGYGVIEAWDYSGRPGNYSNEWGGGIGAVGGWGWGGY